MPRYVILAKSVDITLYKHFERIYYITNTDTAVLSEHEEDTVWDSRNS